MWQFEIVTEQNSEENMWETPVEIAYEAAVISDVLLIAWYTMYKVVEKLM